MPEQQEQQAKLALDDVYKIFGDDPDAALTMLEEGRDKDEILREMGQTVAVAGATVAVRPGETFIIMGLSGSGKSTLVRCVNRLIEPTRGSIHVDGDEVTAMEDETLRQVRRDKLGMVFQSFGLLPHRTVMYNVAYGLKVQGVERKKRRRRAGEIIEMVGLDGWEDSRPASLSGGMQQRVGLARALATDPDILLMDEPFSALDPLIRRRMQEELMQLQDRLQKTILFITHDLDEALKLGDRIGIMNDGRIVQVGTPEEILLEPANDYVAAFVEDVNRAKVLQARHLMIGDAGPVVAPEDSPLEALRLMEEEDVGHLLVVDDDRRLAGKVTEESVIELAKEGADVLEGETCRVPAVSPAQTLRDLIPTATEAETPLPVVADGDGRVRGVVTRRSILRGMVGESPAAGSPAAARAAPEADDGNGAGPDGPTAGTTDAAEREGELAAHE